jgi:hypothetical protein
MGFLRRIFRRSEPAVDVAEPDVFELDPNVAAWLANDARCRQTIQALLAFSAEKYLAGEQPWPEILDVPVGLPEGGTLSDGAVTVSVPILHPGEDMPQH